MTPQELNELKNEIITAINDQTENNAPTDFSNLEVPITHTDQERLNYYKTHGLHDCRNYPGGQKQFEQDVLSGKFHDRHITGRPMKKEDAYIYKSMYDGTFKFDMTFENYFTHPMLLLGYYENCRRNGFAITIDYPGGPEMLKFSILSGAYARRLMDKK